MSGTTAAVKRGPQRHPCWEICQRPSASSWNSICSFCAEAVTADTTVASTHIVFTCTVIPDEKRAWFKQQLRKGCFEDALAPDDLPEDKRRKLFKGQRAGAQLLGC